MQHAIFRGAEQTQPLQPTSAAETRPAAASSASKRHAFPLKSSSCWWLDGRESASRGWRNTESTCEDARPDKFRHSAAFVSSPSSSQRWLLVLCTSGAGRFGMQCHIDSTSSAITTGRLAEGYRELQVKKARAEVTMMLVSSPLFLMIHEAMCTRKAAQRHPHKLPSRELGAVPGYPGQL